MVRSVIIIYVCSFILLTGTRLNFMKASICSLLISGFFCIIWEYIYQKYIDKIVNQDCDPVRFFEIMKKQRKWYKHDKVKLAIIEFNCAVSLMLLGRYEEAKETILGIDKKYMFMNEGSSIAYILDLLLCYYELGEIEKAESLFRENVEKLSTTTNNRVRKNLEILFASRYYYLQQYEKSYIQLEALLSSELNTRLYITILHYLAKMDPINGRKELAISRFREIAQKGNKLWIAEESRQILLTLTS